MPFRWRHRQALIGRIPGWEVEVTAPNHGRRYRVDQTAAVSWPESVTCPHDRAGLRRESNKRLRRWRSLVSILHNGGKVTSIGDTAAHEHVILCGPPAAVHHSLDMQIFTNLPGRCCRSSVPAQSSDGPSWCAQCCTLPDQEKRILPGFESVAWISISV